MLENLPDYVTWVFTVTTFITVGFLLYAVRQARPSKTFFIALTATCAVLLIVHATLALNGFYFVTNTLPPRFPVGPVPTIIILSIFLFSISRKLAAPIPLQILTALHVIRIPVELVLLWLYQNGQVPELMTFEGRNFDVLSGLTAPIVAWLAFRGGKINKPLLVGWNLLALGLLFNIVITSILSAETPFQQMAFEQPNRGVMYFPFIWLPAIIVPIVFVSHLVSLWNLFRRSE